MRVYIMYNVYMDKEEYTVAEFRANIRVALDRADDMNDVYIKRHGRRYFLCGEDYYKELLKPEQPLKPVVVPKTDGTTDITGHDIARVTEVAKSIAPNARFVNGVCKVHGLPLDDRGRCLQKGCKYA